MNILNAANYGVPQSRERVFVVGFRADLQAHWSFPEQTHSQEALLYDQCVTGDYWNRVGVRQPTESGIERIIQRLGRLFPPTHKPWKTVREAIADLPEPFMNEDHVGEIFNHRFQPGARPYLGHTGSAIDAPSKTLKAGAHGVPGGENMIAFGDGTYRYFTIREAARMQSFPDSWRFEGAWSEAMRQLGNALPVDLAKIIAMSVANVLRKERAH